MGLRSPAQLVAELQNYVRSSGVRQDVLSRETGIHQSQISRILAGQCARSRGNLIKLCKYAKISLEDNKVLNLDDFPELLEVIHQVVSGDDKKAHKLARVIKSISPFLI